MSGIFTSTLRSIVCPAGVWWSIARSRAHATIIAIRDALRCVCLMKIVINIVASGFSDSVCFYKAYFPIIYYIRTFTAICPPTGNPLIRYVDTIKIGVVMRISPFGI